jgi:starvation-inducible DNA-binding protein
MSDARFLHLTRIDLPLEIRVYLIALLQQTLACTIDLRSLVKQAIWTVKGTDVFPLQALFATMAAELDRYTDLVATRIVALGGTPGGTARKAVAQSRLPEYPDALVGGSAHVQALAERFAHYATALRTDMVHAMDVEDAGTAHLYTDIVREVEARLGGLDAYLAQ